MCSTQVKTPKFDHIAKYPSVYEPSEDSFLFLDALEKELPFIQSLNPSLIIEIGSGSGVNITALGTALQDINICCLATDINKQACLATKETGTLNKVTIECLNMDLLNSFRNGIFDVILFNPPYVITESKEITGGGIERAWAGGPKGREVMDRLFPKIPHLLTNEGVFYLVAIKENKPDEICDIFTNMNFTAEIVIDRKIPGEHLHVLKFQKL